MFDPNKETWNEWFEVEHRIATTDHSRALFKKIFVKL